MYVWQKKLRLSTDGPLCAHHRAWTRRCSSTRCRFWMTRASVVPIASVKSLTANPTSDPAALFDEQQVREPASPDFMTQMYFDEVYHARTAFEQLHGFVPYENTHPPLGKIFIMFGVYLFGMNPFGWRIVGAVFGIFMLPLLYTCLPNGCSGSTKIAASMATFLFAVRRHAFCADAHCHHRRLRRLLHHRHVLFHVPILADEFLSGRPEKDVYAIRESRGSYSA